MKRIIFLAVAGASVAAQAQSYIAKEVSDEEVSAAKRSRPEVNVAAETTRIGLELVGEWIAEGKVRAKTVFAENFSAGRLDGERWDNGSGKEPPVRIVADGIGGNCIEIIPIPGTWNTVVLKDKAVVPISPAKPMAVLWEARNPNGGNAAWARIDFLDEKLSRISAYQTRSRLDPTQPHQFNRNAVLLNVHMPEGAKFLRMLFFHSKSDIDKAAGQIANVRVVDYSGPAAEIALKAQRTAAERERAKETVLVYCDDSLTGCYPVLPGGASVPGRHGRTLRIRECPGEKTRAAAILWSKRAYGNVTVAFSPLAGREGGVLPATALSAKIVKVHYQAEGAPNGCLALSDRQVLASELLLNDDKLVIPDHDNKRNLVKYRRGGREWYVDINTVAKQKWGFSIPAEDMPIYDAEILQPFDLPERQNLQLALRIAIPPKTPAGIYSGKVDFASGGETIASLPLEIEVLPFALPEKAVTIYDRSREYTMGLYVWATMNRENRAVFSPFMRSESQVRKEWELLLDNGVSHPLFIWFGEIIHDEKEYRRHLKLVREVGFPGKAIRFGGSGLIGSDTDVEKLKAMQQRLKRAMDIAREYGFEDVYFYGYDEATGEKLMSQLTAWRAARAIGAKVVVSNFSRYCDEMAGELDIAVINDDPATTDTAKWHKRGTLLWKYNTPQAGAEDPALFRLNYGLDLWRRGFDGASTYCDVSHCTVWNDIAYAQARKRSGQGGGDVYRGQCMVYPTADGAVETLALTGLESAIKDVRVMTCLRELVRECGDKRAAKWLKSIDYALASPADIRREAIDHILRITARNRSAK
jgi:hypothetical protein